MAGAVSHVYAVGLGEQGSPAAALLAMAQPPWHRDAACKEYDQALFFRFPARPSQPDTSAEARTICQRCLVQAECLALALADPSLVGVWGGTDEAQRRTLRRWEQVALVNGM